MPLLEALMRPAYTAGVGIFDERGWVSGAGVSTTSGIRVGPETALKASAFFAANRILSFTVGRLPIGIFLQGTRDRDTRHWAYQLLSRRPNHWMTPFEFKQWAFSSVIRKGNGYAYMVPGRAPDAPVVELIPIDADRVTPQRLTSNAIVYRIEREYQDSETVRNIVPERVSQERMLHWRSPFGSGLSGMSLISYARETLGLSLAQQSFTERTFSQGLLHKYFVKTPEGKQLGKEASESIKEQLNVLGGLGQAHRALVMPGGTTLEKMSMSLADAQTLELSEFTMVMIAQFTGLPPHMLELVSRSTSWGSGIEAQTIGFNVFTMDPWLVAIEESIDRDMLDNGETHYSKFNRNALLAADMRGRSAFYRVMTGIKAMTPNEVRDREDMDAVEWGDEPLPAPNESPQGAQPVAPTGRGNGQARAIAEAAAGRIVRKEVARVTYLARRNGSDAEAFARAVDEFYQEHAGDVAQALRVDLDEAIAYCEEQRDAVVAYGVGVMETWETGRVEDLAELALGRGSHV